MSFFLLRVNSNIIKELKIFLSMKKVTIIGLGYVGLPLALAIERSKKYDVVGFDISERMLGFL